MIIFINIITICILTFISIMFTLLFLFYFCFYFFLYSHNFYSYFNCRIFTFIFIIFTLISLSGFLLYFYDLYTYFCFLIYLIWKGIDFSSQSMQDLDGICSEIWSQHGDVIGISYKVISYIFLLQKLSCIV